MSLIHDMSSREDYGYPHADCRSGLLTDAIGMPDLTLLERQTPLMVPFGVAQGRHSHHERMSDIANQAFSRSPRASSKLLNSFHTVWRKLRTASGWAQYSAR